MSEINEGSGDLRVDITAPSSRVRKVSETITLCDVKWTLTVALPRDKDEPDITFTLSCGEQTESTLWSYDVAAQFHIANHKFPECSYNRTHKQKFDSIARYVQIVLNKRLSELIDPQAGFTTKAGGWNVGIYLEMHLKVTSHPGIHRLILEDFTVPRVHLRDAVLVVEGKKLYVCKQMMAMASKFFHSLFFPDSIDSEDVKPTEIPIANVGYKNFVGFLNLIHSPALPIHEDNVESFLELSDRFGCDQLLKKCGREMINMEHIMLWKKFKFAEEYKLVELQTSCFTTFKTISAKNSEYMLNVLAKAGISFATRQKLRYLRDKNNN